MHFGKSKQIEIVHTSRDIERERERKANWKAKCMHVFHMANMYANMAIQLLCRFFPFSFSHPPGSTLYASNTTR